EGIQDCFHHVIRISMGTPAGACGAKGQPVLANRPWAIVLFPKEKWTLAHHEMRADRWVTRVGINEPCHNGRFVGVVASGNRRMMGAGLGETWRGDRLSRHDPGIDSTRIRTDNRHRLPFTTRRKGIVEGSTNASLL